MTSPGLAAPARALFVGARGLLALWSRAGCDVTVVCVTDVLEDRVRACSAHSSQTPMLDRGVEEELWDWLGARARGLPEGRYAETYQVLDTA
jgi:hypothetical protein